MMLCCLLVELINCFCGILNCLTGAIKIKCVATTSNIYLQSFFDNSYILVKLAAEYGKAASIEGFKQKARFWFCGKLFQSGI